MQDIMVDLETLGTSPGCIILSIGAVEFDRTTGALGREFYSAISKKSCVAAGLFTDFRTEHWWSQQTEAARNVLTEVEQWDTHSLTHVLAEFKSFCTHTTFDVNMWGNGANFDNAILEFAYHAVDMAPGWRYNKNRCFRTLVDLAGPDIEWDERIGTFHNALDDAKTQAVHAVKCFKHLNWMLMKDEVESPAAPTLTERLQNLPIAGTLVSVGKPGSGMFAPGTFDGL